MDCLGFIKGNNCPHYDGEKDRRPSVHDMISTSKLNSCYASDDGAALHFKNEEVLKSVNFYKNANSYLIRKNLDNEIIEEIIPGINII